MASLNPIVWLSCKKTLVCFFLKAENLKHFFSGYYENIYVTIKQDRTSCLYTGPALFTCFSFFRLWTFPLLFFYDGKFLPITITCRNFHMMIGHYVWIFPPIWPPLPQRKTRKCSNMLFLSEINIFVQYHLHVDGSCCHGDKERN